MFSCSVMSDSSTPWIAARQVSLSITNSQSLLKLTSIESMMPSNHLVFCRPLLLPSIFPRIRAFSNELALHIRWPKYWSFNFSLSPSNEYSGLFSIRIYSFDLLAVKGSQESSAAPQFEGINSLALSLLNCPSLTSIHDTGKIIGLTRWAFVGKIMSLLFNMLSRLVIAFLPRSKHLLI